MSAGGALDKIVDPSLAECLHSLDALAGASREKSCCCSHAWGFWAQNGDAVLLVLCVQKPTCKIRLERGEQSHRTLAATRDVMKRAAHMPVAFGHRTVMQPLHDITCSSKRPVRLLASF
jgi:hypothetical protein